MVIFISIFGLTGEPYCSHKNDGHIAKRSVVNIDYVSKPSPSLGVTVKIGFKVFKEAPVKSAELRVVIWVDFYLPG